MDRLLKYTVFLLLFISQIGFTQNDIANIKYAKKVFDKKGENLLMIGENHTSAVGPKVFEEMVKYLHKKEKLVSIMVEAGPSDAYFYNKYLETGNEKHLNYTINAGSYVEWKQCWQAIYEYNKDQKKKFVVIGVDFDRTRTLGYAIYSVLRLIKEKPEWVDEMMAEIRSDAFFKNYTIGYPTEKDQAWTRKTKSILREHIGELKALVSKQDFQFLNDVLHNQAIGYGGDREFHMADNVKRIMEERKARNFFLFLGRSHTYIDAIYDDEPRLATLLEKEANIDLSTGVILYQNSEMRGGKKHQKIIVLDEIETKIPWKEYESELLSVLDDEKRKTIIPLTGELESLNSYTHFLLVAKNGKAITVRTE
ncbi:TraB/GumN family protein [Membranihabitans marinus]|uniref:hypothetical protein n=1 Tax=Membranihabitans marinus TaxID=1227546 RepID=UPI001F3D00C6|nr:hypothetical protein [Membranihabitans marinus]